MRHLLFVLLLSGLTPAFAQKSITLDDCFAQFKFYPESGPDFRFMKDGRHYTLVEKGNIVRYDLVTQKQDSVLVKKSEIKIKFEEYAFSENEQLLLLSSNIVPVYRHSVKADYHIFDLKTRKTLPINDGTPAQYVSLSPDGTKAAFVMNNDVYIKILADQSLIRVTDDGMTNKIINGLPDWVYEEEFSPVTGEGMKALEWNPDGNRLAFLRFNETAVQEMPITWYEGGMYPRQSAFKYPKVGTPNSTVSLKIFDLPSGHLADCPDIKKSNDDYIVRLNWASKFNLVATRLNRMQDTLDLVLLAPERLGEDLAFAPELLLRETDPAYVEVHDNLIFLEEQHQYVWASERSGFNHLYLYDFISGVMQRPLTSGNFDVTEFYGVDEKNGRFYYQTASPTPMDRQVWEGFIDGSAPRLLTKGTGTFAAEFSPTFDYYTLNWSDVNTPAIVTLHDRAGALIQTLTDNKEKAELRTEYGFVT